MFSNVFVIQLLDYLDYNLYKRITMDELSQSFHYHKDYIMRVFKREIHMTIIDYMNQKRIYHSLDSLKYSNQSILTVALNYGFTSLEYFSETFHHVMGVSPSVYRSFVNHSTTISEGDVIVIQDHLASISSNLKRIEVYRQNTPPQSMVKIISIFK